jgi:hypothetical protein
MNLPGEKTYQADPCIGAGRGVRGGQFQTIQSAGALYAPWDRTGLAEHPGVGRSRDAGISPNGCGFVTLDFSHLWP